MALTYSGLVNTVVGNMRMVVFNWTSDSETEYEIGTGYHGLSKIFSATPTKASGTTQVLGTTAVWTINADSSGVASAGCIGYSGFIGAASAVVCWTVYGV